MSTHITETTLSRRVTNALCRYGLFTVEEVIEYHNAHDIATVKSIGVDAVREINDVILIPAGFGIPPKQPKVKKEKPQPKPRKKSLGRNMDRYVRFKQYFDELYGQGLEVANWHQNGGLEPFDNFYESAIEYSLRKENNK